MLISHRPARQNNKNDPAAMTRHPISRLTSTLRAGLWVCMVLLPGQVLGQLSNFDKATLVDTLAEHGMNELLDHLIKVESSDDPAIRDLVGLAQLRVHYGGMGVDDPERLVVFDKIVDASRSLIKNHYDHELRPLWQTDLSNMWLFEYLRSAHKYCGEFYEFGVPTAEQHQAFESVVAQAFEQLSDADIRFFELQTELPRQPDHDVKRVGTGLWTRMIDEYYKTRTQFLIAHAAYYTALLGDDHPYYKNLNNPKIPRQKKTAKEERERLFALTVEKLQELSDDESKPPPLRFTSLCLSARAAARLKATPPDQAIEGLDGVAAQTNAGDLNNLLCQMAKAAVLDKQDRANEGEQLLSGLFDHSVVKHNIQFRLLVVDQMHRLMLGHAYKQPKESRAAAIAQAYTPYEELLSDPVLGDKAEALKNYIYARWESAAEADADLADLPTAVLEAACERSRINGHALVIQADQLDPESQEEQAEQLHVQAKPKLEKTIQLSLEILQRESASPRVRAGAMFNQGMATFLLARGEMDQILEAIKIWIDLSEQMPDQKISEEAIAAAITTLRELYTQQSTNADVTEAYVRAGEVLFEKFPTSKTSDTERLYYAFYLLAPQGQHAQVVEILDKVPTDHTLYFEARREMLLSLKQLFDQAQKVADKNAAQKRVIESANGLITQAKNDLATVTGEQAQITRNAMGVARLILVDMSIAQGDLDAALKQLDGFENEFQDDNDLVRDALARGIVALAQAGKFGDLVLKARAMTDKFPDDAAVVIDGVLTDLTTRIDRLRRDAQLSQVQREKDQMQQQAESFAQAAQMLAELLLDWAVRQGLAEDDIVPYKLILAKATVLAGKPDSAIGILKPLLEKNSDAPDLIDATAEALFVKGDRDSLVEAGALYNRLIGGLPRPHPPMWWEAWMRRLQIVDQIGDKEGKAEIPLRIRALEREDPALGGELYRPEFKRLELKHSR